MIIFFLCLFLVVLIDGLVMLLIFKIPLVIVEPTVIFIPGLAQQQLTIVLQEIHVWMEYAGLLVRVIADMLVVLVQVRYLLELVMMTFLELLAVVPLLL